MPVVTTAQQSLLEFALLHAQGKGEMLFAAGSNFRRDLDEACTRAGVEHCSPNDLRRTAATWLRIAGAPLELIAPMMGHADTRMLERVYARLPTHELASRLRASLAADHCCRVVANDVETRGNSRNTGRELNSASEEDQEFEVPGAGIEPATRGFSIPCSTD